MSWRSRRRRARREARRKAEGGRRRVGRAISPDRVGFARVSYRLGRSIQSERQTKMSGTSSCASAGTDETPPAPPAVPATVSSSPKSLWMTGGTSVGASQSCASGRAWSSDTTLGAGSCAKSGSANSAVTAPPSCSAMTCPNAAASSERRGFECAERPSCSSRAARTTGDRASRTWRVVLSRSAARSSAVARSLTSSPLVPAVVCWAWGEQRSASACSAPSGVAETLVRRGWCALACAGARGARGGRRAAEGGRREAGGAGPRASPPPRRRALSLGGVRVRAEPPSVALAAPSHLTEVRVGCGALAGVGLRREEGIRRGHDLRLRHVRGGGPIVQSVVAIRDSRQGQKLKADQSATMFMAGGTMARLQLRWWLVFDLLLLSSSFATHGGGWIRGRRRTAAGARRHAVPAMGGGNTRSTNKQLRRRLAKLDKMADRVGIYVATKEEGGKGGRVVAGSAEALVPRGEVEAVTISARNTASVTLTNGTTLTVNTTSLHQRYGRHLPLRP